MKRLIRPLLMIESQIRGLIALSRFCYFRVPVLGRALALLLDRFLLLIYGLDVTSAKVEIAQLSISHPSGVLLGGNGIVSQGRVAVMSGVKFVGRSPSDPTYQEAHRAGIVFALGDNVVIGANSVIIGPVSICDNVIVGAMSLVNRSIEMPGVYVGTPARLIEAAVSDEWVAHLEKKESA